MEFRQQRNFGQNMSIMFSDVIEVEGSRILLAYPEGIVPRGHVRYVYPLAVNIVKIGIDAANRNALIAMVGTSIDLEQQFENLRILVSRMQFIRNVRC